MEKKQKIFITSVCLIVIISIIILIIYAVTNIGGKSESKDENRLANIYERMTQNETYSITFQLNDNNRYTVYRKGDVANIDTYDDGNHTAHIVKDGNTYLLMYEMKQYYIYQNNSSELTELTNELNEIIQSQEPETGKEKIDGVNYRYEEYKGVSYFLMNTDEEVSEENTNTRFYFDDDNLKYIKTTAGDKSELISVNISYDVDDSVFDIPSDFQEG